MINQPNIETVVMRRVRRIHVLRPIVSGTALSALILILALYGIGREVWVAKVFSNGPQTFFGHTEYLLYAFGHTRAIVQALCVISLAALVYLARETARLISTFFITPAHA